MDDSYNSPFTYGPGPYYIPDHNLNYIQAPDYIHPDSIAGRLGLTPMELAPILQEQQELMWDKFAQPPTRPATYHNHYTPAIPLPPLQPHLQLNPTPYLLNLMANQMFQAGYTKAKLTNWSKTASTSSGHSQPNTKPKNRLRERGGREMNRERMMERSWGKG